MVVLGETGSGWSTEANKGVGETTLLRDEQVRVEASPERWPLALQGLS